MGDEMSLWEQASQATRTWWAPVYVAVSGIAYWVWKQDAKVRELEREFKQMRKDMQDDRNVAQSSREKIDAKIDAGFGNIGKDVRELRAWLMQDHQKKGE